MRRALPLFVLLLSFAERAAGPVHAQEGHPLTGTWAGDWGPAANDRRHLTLVMTWDGTNVVGTINPGPDAVPISSLFVDFPDWTIRLQADAKDKAGHAVPIAAEGRLEDLGSAHRRIVGTWREGATSGDFRVRRE